METPNLTLTNGTTKADQLKADVLKAAKQLLTNFEEDINTGISGGYYNKNDNAGNLEWIEETKKLFDEFEKIKMEVYVYVEGGNIQGASANMDGWFNVYDKDNLECCTEEEERLFIESNGTPEEWDKMIKDKTGSGEIIPIY